VCGASGIGKTTLLRLFCHDEIPTEGHIFYDGEDISTFKNQQLLAYRRRFGRIFHTPYLIVDRSVLENIEIAGRLSGKSQGEIKENAKNLMDAFGIVKIANRYPRELSSSQVQRVCIARALVNNPEWIIADEPWNNMDKENCVLVNSVFTDMSLNGTGLLIATTREDVWKNLSSEPLRLAAGKIISKKK
jgi:ABC-type ATPase involved in cell division